MARCCHCREKHSDAQPGRILSRERQRNTRLVSCSARFRRLRREASGASALAEFLNDNRGGDLQGHYKAKLNQKQYQNDEERYPKDGHSGNETVRFSEDLAFEVNRVVSTRHAEAVELMAYPDVRALHPDAVWMFLLLLHYPARLP